MGKEHSNTKRWRLLTALAVVLCIITFTPLVIPQGIYKPELFGIPYTLWTGFLITVALVVLTYLGTKVYHHDEEKGGGA